MARNKPRGKTKHVIIEVDATKMIEDMMASGEEVQPIIRAYRLGLCFIIVAYSKKLGWHMSISHPERYPHMEEVRVARENLLSSNIIMALIIQNGQEDMEMDNTYHLFEINRIAE